jgi:hypothetical protein
MTLITNSRATTLAALTIPTTTGYTRWMILTQIITSCTLYTIRKSTTVNTLTHYLCTFSTSIYIIYFLYEVSILTLST